jgi:hypothetical protein
MSIDLGPETVRIRGRLSDVAQAVSSSKERPRIPSENLVVSRRFRALCNIRPCSVI